MMWAHEHVRVVHDPESGLRAVIAIHSTVLGPALGGLRLRAYLDTGAAVEDALRLSAAMTFKAAAAGLDLGGGKSVIIDDGDRAGREARLRRFGTELADLDGRYITAEDIGTRTADMDLLSEVTRWVVGRSAQAGGGGDPSPSTARTVLGAIRHGCRVRLGRADLDGVSVGVLGLGKVGYDLVRALTEEGAHVTVADLDEGIVSRAQDEFGVRSSPADDLVLRDHDVLAPCAVGGLITDVIARSLSARVVAGAANNMLADEAVADVLASREVLYVPDYLANSGGLIHCSDELDGFDRRRVESRVDAAIARIADVLDEAAARAETPSRIAEERVNERLSAASAAAVA